MIIFSDNSFQCLIIKYNSLKTISDFTPEYADAVTVLTKPIINQPIRKQDKANNFVAPVNWHNRGRATQSHFPINLERNSTQKTTTPNRDFWIQNTLLRVFAQMMQLLFGKADIRAARRIFRYKIPIFIIRYQEMKLFKFGFFPLIYRRSV